MHSSKKGNQWYFGMKAHIGVDADSGLVHTVRGTSGRVADVTEGNSMLHAEETVVFADAWHQGAEKRTDTRPDARWQVAMRRGKRRKLDKAGNPVDTLIDKVEKLKASIRVKVGLPMNAVSASQSMRTARRRAQRGRSDWLSSC